MNKNLFYKRAASLAAAAAFAASVFALAPVAQASSLTSQQISAITNLLQAFGADPATIANVQSVLQGSAGTSTSSSGTASTTWPTQGNSGGNASSEGATQSMAHASSCSTISSGLSLGDSGEAVTKLQQFLAKDKSVYPQGLVTGYYGHLTEDAVQRFQATHNIVASGTPTTTGYGLVGPHTLGEVNHEMEMECEGGDSSHSSTSSTSSDSGNGDHSAGVMIPVGGSASSSDSASGSSDN